MKADIVRGTLLVHFWGTPGKGLLEADLSNEVSMMVRPLHGGPFSGRIVRT